MKVHRPGEKSPAGASYGLPQGRALRRFPDMEATSPEFARDNPLFGLIISFSDICSAAGFRYRTPLTPKNSEVLILASQDRACPAPAIRAYLGIGPATDRPALPAAGALWKLTPLALHARLAAPEELAVARRSYRHASARYVGHTSQIARDGRRQVTAETISRNISWFCRCVLSKET